MSAIGRNTPIRPDYRHRKSISGGLTEKRRMARANRKIADANALAAPEAGQVKPQSDQVGGATAAATPGDDRSGVYRGQMCYAAGGATEPAHCFEAQGVVLGDRITGEWPGREPGVTIYLAGEISRAGEVAIHMHSKRADGFFGRDPRNAISSRVAVWPSYCPMLL
jgi:hypothetical protein